MLQERSSTRCNPKLSSKTYIRDIQNTASEIINSYEFEGKALKSYSKCVWSQYR